MNITLDHIVALALGRLNAADALAVRSAMARSAELRAAFDRFAFVAQTTQADAAEPVPASALRAAKELGRRLEANRSPSLLERIDDAVRSLVARLAFDSRLDGPIVGLRGGTGFVLSYEVDGPAGRTDIDLECIPANPMDADSAADLFDLVGMASGIGSGVLTAERTDASDQRFETASDQRFETTVDQHGMFRIRLAAGTYRLHLTPAGANAAPIELPTLDLP